MGNKNLLNYYFVTQQAGINTIDSNHGRLTKFFKISQLNHHTNISHTIQVIFNWVEVK